VHLYVEARLLPHHIALARSEQERVLAVTDSYGSGPAAQLGRQRICKGAAG
jgi:hypothetical protein